MSQAMKSLFCRISKVDEEKRTVTGIGASEFVDAEGEVFDYATSKPYVEAWSAAAVARSQGKSYGNIREMHGLSAAGKLSEPVIFDDTQKFVILTCYVSDDAAWAKCLDGTYTGFSICGPVIGEKWSDPTQPGVKRFTCSPIEFSLVDLPCNPDAVFTAVKAGGVTEERKFKAAAAVEETPVPETVKKSMYSICDLACAIASLRWIQDDLAYEADYDGDNSPIPDKLKSWLTEGCNILVDLTREETSELAMQMKSMQAFGTKVLQKALSAPPQDSVAKAADTTAAQAAPITKQGDSPEIEDEMDEATKAQIAAAEQNSAKALDLATKTNEAVTALGSAVEKFMTALGAEPVAAKSVTPAAAAVVAKSQDAGGAAAATEAGSTPESVAKSILANPRAVTAQEASTLRIGR